MALTDSLISAWELEATSGTRVDAVVASANDLSDNNTVTQAAGKVGNAAQFTIANAESLSRADNNSLSTNTAAAHTVDITVLAWVYLDAKAADQIFVNKGSAGGDEYILAYSASADRFQLTLDDGGTVDRATANNFGSPSAATWYLVIGTLIGSTGAMTISVNAGTRDTGTVTHWPSDTAGTFYLGRYWASGFESYFGGRMDQVCFWKRAISTGEEASMYNGGSGLSYAAMVAAFMARQNRIGMTGTVSRGSFY